ncbi:MAG: Holliday junction resolvase-like protein [Candidatus Anstonellaceae archaeon]
MDLSNSDFFFIGLFLGSIILTLFFFFLYLPYRIKMEREDAIKRSRSSISGQALEQFAPYFRDFPFSASEARFIGKPIDFIVFQGLDNKKVEKIIFVEVKSGKSFLSQVQKSIREIVENKKIEWFEFFIKK